jgi:hypothetical protein
MSLRSRTRKPVKGKTSTPLRSWRASLIRKHAHNAPDRAAAEAAAVKAFNLDEEQRSRLVVQERG